MLRKKKKNKKNVHLAPKSRQAGFLLEFLFEPKCVQIAPQKINFIRINEETPRIFINFDSFRW